MLSFRLFGFPVRVDPWFWLVSAMLGGAAYKLGRPGGTTEVLLWMVMVFVSVLWHELGHALVMRRFGSQSEILLYGGGGLATASRARFTRRQDFLVSAAGPAAGLLLWLATLAFFRQFPPTNPIAYYIALQMVGINLIWSLVNLMPILPLDGGHMLGAILGPNRRRALAMVGVVASAFMIAFGVLRLQSVFVAIMFGFFLWHNWKMYRNPWNTPERPF